MALGIYAGVAVCRRRSEGLSVDFRSGSADPDPVDQIASVGIW